MNIALVAGSFLPHVGGMEWKVHFLAVEYARRGHDVLILAPRPHRSIQDEPMPADLPYKVRRCGWTLPGLGRLGIMQRLMASAIKSAHGRHPLDVLHCHPLGITADAALRVRKVLGVPVVATTSGSDVMWVLEPGESASIPNYVKEIVVRCASEVDLIGSVSSSTRAALARMDAKSPIVDIPNGVALEAFQRDYSRPLRSQLGLADDECLILSVGRNIPSKGYRDGIVAFGRVVNSNPESHYAIVGRDVSSLGDAIKQQGLAGRVHLIEQRPMSEIPAIFQSADIFFNPSTREGFAQVNAQALATGLPLVITDSPGNVDAARYGGALVARAEDAADMAEKLICLVVDVGRRKVLGAQAREAGRQFAWSRIAEQYLELFEDLRRKKGRRMNSVSERKDA
jgi:phosphatidylinositol alpha 1,6-mannosyltransferase